VSAKFEDQRGSEAQKAILMIQNNVTDLALEDHTQELS
jgi:hypothetical protein